MIIRLFVFIILNLLIIRILCYGEEKILPEYEIKAVYIYNFAKYITWPDNAFESPEAPLFFCIVGSNPFGNALNTIENKMVKGRNLKTKLCGTMECITECHILFISSSKKKELSKIMSILQGLPVLIISESKKSIYVGVMIVIFKVGEKVRFNINWPAAQRAQLHISSHLLKLAGEVINE